MPTVETRDVQSLVFSGHGKLPHALAVWLAVRERTAARGALRTLVDEHLSFGLGSDAERPGDVVVQIALSSAGLAALDAPPGELRALDRPFQRGVAEPHRSRALGDVERNDPAKWAWGDREAHALLLIYGLASHDVSVHGDELVDRLAVGWSCIARLPIRLPSDSREPFGFRDGLVRVRVDVGDAGDGEPGVDVLPAGEVLLGHRSAAGIVAPVPALGRNGTYLVVRQLAQDVEDFWRHWKSRGITDEASVWLAAKAVGRWPNGMPVDGSAPGPQPACDDAIALGSLSFRDDPFGDRCPLGAHIRRANPRDGMSIGPERSSAIAAQHRILRRGRVYGSPTPREWLPPSIAADAGRDSIESASDERGLLFMCLCADIARQFEFVQQTWLNNPKLAGLFDEVDPISAGDGIAGDARRFTIPRDPLRRRIDGVQRWVTVRGAGYFLLAGRSALRGLSERGVPPDS